MASSKAARRKRRRKKPHLKLVLPNELEFKADVQLTARGEEEGRLPSFRIMAYGGGKMRPQGFKSDVIVDLSDLEFAQVTPVLLDHESSAIVGHTQIVSVDDGQLVAMGIVSGEGEAAREVVSAGRNGFPWKASIGSSIKQRRFVASGKTATVNGRSQSGPFHVLGGRLKEISFTSTPADDSSQAMVANRRLEMPATFEEFLDQMNLDQDDMSEDQIKAMRSHYESLQANEDDEEDAQDVPSRTITPGRQDILASDHALAPLPYTTIVAGNGYPSAPPHPQQQPYAHQQVPWGVYQMPFMPPMPQYVQATQPQLQPQQPTQQQPEEPQFSVRDEMKAEAARQSKIRSLTKDDPELQAKAISEDWTAERTELEVLRASRKKGPAIHSSDDGVNEDILPDVVECSLCRQLGVKDETIKDSYPEDVINASTHRKHRRWGIQRIMRHMLRAKGQTDVDDFDGDTIRAAFKADEDIGLRANMGFSTLSLSGTLSNVANKLLLDGYNSVPMVGPSIAAEATHSDFKEHTKYRLTGEGTFLKVGPGGEIKHMEIGEDQYANQVETYARMIALTRTMIVNDDLNAFSQIPRMLGRSAALRLEEAVFTLLLSNPGDFFDATPAVATDPVNRIEGAGGAFAVGSITTAEKLLRNMTDRDGKPIMVTPAILLVGTALAVTADLHMNERNLVQIDITGAPAVEQQRIGVNPHAGKFEVFSTPYLNSQGIAGGSDTKWFLLADPEDIAVIEIAYLSGSRTPVIESSEADFNTLGMQWRGVFDFGVAMQDKHGGVQVDGA